VPGHLVPGHLVPGHLVPGPVAWDQARLAAHAAPAPLEPQSVPLGQAAGLTLAVDLRARGPLPAFDTAAMDGYAVCPPGPFRLRGQVAAGQVWDQALRPGQAVGISTGAPVPAGAGTVLRLEDAVLVGGLVSGPDQPPGAHIRRAGEDAAPGTPVAPAGTAAGPALLGLAATCGHDRLLVIPRPRISVLVTGNELSQAGVSGAGRVRDALGPMLPALIDQLGGVVTEVAHVPDDRAQLALALSRAQSGGSPVIVVTGSTSVGRSDHLRALLDDGGARWIVDSVACRPGHPQLLAGLTAGGWLVGLPGNPFAALVAAHTLLGPLLAGLAGRALAPLPRAQIRGAVQPAPAGQTRLLPVAWDDSGVRVLAGHQPAFLRGAAVSDALAAVPAGWTPGQPVPLVLTR
jgi:molybdopterin molybdotransferase